MLSLSHTSEPETYSLHNNKASFGYLAFFALRNMLEEKLLRLKGDIKYFYDLKRKRIIRHYKVQLF